jgi:hypothetical protein
MNSLPHSKHVELAEGKVIQLDNEHEMAATGWSNPTPGTPIVEEPDDLLLKRIEATVSKVRNPGNAIFACTPRLTAAGWTTPRADQRPAPHLRRAFLVPVGKSCADCDREVPATARTARSRSRRQRHQKYKRTLCINPGSMYEQGILHGAVIELKLNKSRAIY